MESLGLFWPGVGFEMVLRTWKTQGNDTSIPIVSYEEGRKITGDKTAETPVYVCKAICNISSWDRCTYSQGAGRGPGVL